MTNVEKNKFTPESESEGAIGGLREKVVGVVNESIMPSEKYESTVGIYGGKLKEDAAGKMYFDMTGLVSGIDQRGDAILRTFDEHIMKNPLEVLKRHPKWFFKFLKAGTKRYRGSPEEIAEHVAELGLDEYYGLHDKGIEIKDPGLFKKGIVLQDIYRSDEINSNELEQIDRFDALAQASGYVSKVHSEHGPIGEVLSGDIIFHTKEGGGIEKPTLNIPDIVYNPNIKKKGDWHDQKEESRERDQKATDMLDFMFHIGVEELRRSEGDWSQVERALNTILDNYNNKDVISWMKVFAKKGRLTLVGDSELLAGEGSKVSIRKRLLSQHNKARLSTKTEYEGKLRQQIIEICDEHLDISK